MTLQMPLQTHKTIFSHQNRECRSFPKAPALFLLLQHDKCTDISTFSSACPVTEQELRIAGRTDIRHRNILLLYSCLHQRNPAGLPQIQLTMSGVPAIFQKLFFFPGKSQAELLRHILADLIMVPADGRSDSNQKIRRIRPKFLLHRAHRLRTDFSNRSSPAGMTGSDRVPNRIHE